MIIAKRSIIILGAVVLFLIIGLHTGCRDPYDYEPPPPDTLIHSPAAPVLLYPPDSFVFMTETPYVDIIMRWATVDSAEQYLLEFGGYTISLDTNSWAGIDNIEFGPYHWRVKAASSRWIDGYTDWSETRILDTKPIPEPPLLSEPYDGAVFHDSLPRGVRFTWCNVAHAHYYEFELFLDTNLFCVENPSTTECIIYLDLPGQYYWHVRTNDELWQYNTDWSELWSFRINE